MILHVVSSFENKYFKNQNGLRNKPNSSSAICAKAITKRLSDSNDNPSPSSEYLVEKAHITAIGINKIEHQNKIELYKDTNELTRIDDCNKASNEVILKKKHIIVVINPYNDISCSFPKNDIMVFLLTIT